jgi:subtilisin family serine protease
LPDLKDPRIRSVVPFQRKRILNRYIGGFLESGDEEPFVDDGAIGSNHALRRFLNLTGEGEVIVVVDTGVDSLHPHFFDPDRGSVFGPSHRKIVAIDDYADSLDMSDGHGTHVSGTALGASYDRGAGVALYDGVAPGAKLHMIDCALVTDTDEMSGEFDSWDLYEDLAENHGRAIASNSWGYDVMEGTEDITVEYDAIAHAHPGLTMVFAAGNDGDLYGDDMHFIVSAPADSKNVLGVGSVTGPRCAKLEVARKWFVANESASVQVTPDTIFCADPWAIMRQAKAKRFANGSGLLFASGDVCAQIAAKPGIMAVVLEDGTALRKCTVPAGIACFVGQKLPTGGNFSLFAVPTAAATIRRVSDFSSRGPTVYGVVKPDLLSPGEEVWSARAGRPESKSQRPLDWSSILEMGGTSMSAPAVAGLAALVRQFFAQGMYPSLVKTTQGFSPTAALIRAMLIASAQPIGGGAGPTPEAGFGVPDLASAIPPQGEFGLRVADGREIRETERHTYEITVEQTGRELRAVLAYIDPGLSPEHEMPLWADLDLFVISPSGRVFTGNALEGGETEQFNTIERVIIEAPDVERGKYTIIVLSSAFPDATATAIKYAVVVTGPFDHSDFVANPPEFNHTNGGECLLGCGAGTCKAGRCVCPEGKFGISCEREYTKVPALETWNGRLVPGVITRVVTPVTFCKSSMTATITAYLGDRAYEGMIAACLSSQPLASYAGEPFRCEFPTQSDFTTLSFSFTATPSAGNVTTIPVYVNLFVIGYTSVKASYRLAADACSHNDIPTATIQGGLDLGGVPSMAEFIGVALVCGVLMVGISALFGGLFLGTHIERETIEPLVGV